MVALVGKLIPLLFDMALLLLFTALCWFVTDGFRRNRLLLVPLILGAIYLCFEGVISAPTIGSASRQYVIYPP